MSGVASRSRSAERRRTELHELPGNAERSTTRRLPTLPALARLLPGGGLAPGSAYTVSPGLLLLAMLAEPSRWGSWCGVVGIPELGVEAAEQAGLNLSRVALVPRPGERWFAITAALAEVLPVVAVHPASRVRDSDAARLAARLRNSGTVLLATGFWPRAEAVLSLSGARWSGIGAGSGYLAVRQVRVSVTSKRFPAARQVRLTLPDNAGRLDSSSIDAAEGELYQGFQSAQPSIISNSQLAGEAEATSRSRVELPTQSSLREVG